MNKRYVTLLNAYVCEFVCIFDKTPTKGSPVLFIFEHTPMYHIIL